MTFEDLEDIFNLGDLYMNGERHKDLKKNNEREVFVTHCTGGLFCERSGGKLEHIYAGTDLMNVEDL